MAEHWRKDIESIFTSRPGQRLIATLMTVQPLTRKELQHFLPLSMAIFKPSTSLTKDFPDVEKIDIEAWPAAKEALRKVHPEPTPMTSLPLNEYVEYIRSHKKDESRIDFADIIQDTFNDRDLYHNKGVLKQAEQCGLIRSVPVEKGKDKPRYYFLNSDLEFVITPGNFKVREKTETHFHKSAFDEYTTTIWKDGKNHEEWLSLPSTELTIEFYRWFADLWDTFFNYIKWNIEKPDEMREVWELFQEEKLSQKGTIQIRRKEASWHHELFNRAVREGLLMPGKMKYFKLHPWLKNDISSFMFSRTYEPLKCFDNLDQHSIKVNNNTPMQLLEILISGDYKIVPESRRMAFTSISGHSISLVDKSSEEGEVPYIVNRNTQLAPLLLSPQSPVFRTNKNEYLNDFLSALQTVEGYRNL